MASWMSRADLGKGVTPFEGPGWGDEESGGDDESGGRYREELLNSQGKVSLSPPKKTQLKFLKASFSPAANLNSKHYSHLLPPAPQKPGHHHWFHSLG